MEERRQAMRGRLLSVLGSRRALALLATVAIGTGGLLAFRSLLGTSAAPARTVAVARGSVFQTVAFAGAVAPAQQLRLAFRVPGRLSGVNVSVGQRVSTDQPLATLEAADLRAAFAAAQARYDQVLSGAPQQDVAIARQAVENARRGLDAAQRTGANDVAVADLALARLRANFTQSRVNLPTNFESLTSELNLLQLDSLLGQLDTTRTELNGNIPPEPTPNPLTGIPPPPSHLVADGIAAQVALGQARASVNNATVTVNGPLKDALAEYQVAVNGLVVVGNDLGAAVSSGGDLTATATVAVGAQSAYIAAAARVGGALETIAAQLTLAQGAMTSAQGSLEDAASRGIGNYTAAHTDLAATLQIAAGSVEHLTAARARFGVATTAANVIADAAAGSYAAAQQNVATARERAAATVVAARNGLDAANAALAKVVAPARQLDLDAAKAAVDAAEASLAQATLRAPVGGIVAAVNGRSGELVGPTAPVIVLSDTSAFLLRGLVSEAEIGGIAPGQMAGVSIEALANDSPLRAVVTSVDPAATVVQGAPTYGVEVTIQQDPGRVRAGMSGTALITVASREGVLVVPTAALRGRGAHQSVLVSGESRPRDIEVGLADELNAEVLSGLAEGEQVVLPQPGELRAPAATPSRAARP